MKSSPNSTTELAMQYRYGTPAINAKLAALAEEKHHKTETFIVKAMPSPMGINTFAFLGTYSMSVPAWKSRYVLADVAMHPYGFTQTPTELARQYLDAKYDKKPRQFHDQYIVNRYTKAWPYLAKPGHYQDYCYIDLKSAYWSIVQLAGWNADYMPGKWLAQKSSMSDFPFPDNRLARNTLVSTTTVNDMRVWTGTEVAVKNLGNKNTNYQIHRLVMDVLHGIASYMEDLGAVYIHTDGYIVPGYMAAPAINLIQCWGLPARVKHHGFTVVRGVGCYMCGDHKSGHFGHQTERTERYILPANREWLMKRMGKLSTHTPLFFGKGDKHNTVEYGDWLRY